MHSKSFRDVFWKRREANTGTRKISEGKPTPAQNREANTSTKQISEGKLTPAQRWEANTGTCNHFHQTPYSLNLRFAHDHAVVFYSKTRSKCADVHIHVHMPSASAHERSMYNDARLSRSGISKMSGKSKQAIQDRCPRLSVTPTMRSILMPLYPMTPMMKSLSRPV